MSTPAIWSVNVWSGIVGSCIFSRPELNGSVPVSLTDQHVQGSAKYSEYDRYFLKYSSETEVATSVSDEYLR